MRTLSNSVNKHRNNLMIASLRDCDCGLDFNSTDYREGEDGSITLEYIVVNMCRTYEGLSKLYPIDRLGSLRQATYKISRTLRDMRISIEAKDDDWRYPFE